MLNDMQQKSVWEGWLTSEIRSNYFADLSGRYQRTQRFITWNTLILSSGAFATLVSDWLPPNMRVIRPIVAFCVVALSLWSLLARYERNGIDCTDLHFKWNTLACEFERLWCDIYPASAVETLYKLQNRETELSKSSTSFPNKEKLMLKWEEHTVRQRGMELPR
jgi:hypothetical protein